MTHFRDLQTANMPQILKNTVPVPVLVRSHVWDRKDPKDPCGNHSYVIIVYCALYTILYSHAWSY